MHGINYTYLQLHEHVKSTHRNITMIECGPSHIIQLVHNTKSNYKKTLFYHYTMHALHLHLKVKLFCNVHSQTSTCRHLFFSPRCFPIVVIKNVFVG